MSYIDSIAGWLPPDAWATYLIGAAAITIGVWQWRRTFRLNKRSAVFDELSSDISEATTLLNSIDSSTDSIINELANAANRVSSDLASLNETHRNEELNRRKTDLDKIAETHIENLNSIYDSYKHVLLIIEKVEKSTVVSEKSKQSARHLYFLATDQHNLTTAANKVLQSFNVTPPLGDDVNISPETFNSFKELVNLIGQQNNDIRTYLDDLEVILHNDLVRKVYGKKAHYSSIPTKHLTPNGLIDSRSKESVR